MSKRVEACLSSCFCCENSHSFIGPVFGISQNTECLTCHEVFCGACRSDVNKCMKCGNHESWFACCEKRKKKGTIVAVFKETEDGCYVYLVPMKKETEKLLEILEDFHDVGTSAPGSNSPLYAPTSPPSEREEKSDDWEAMLDKFGGKEYNIGDGSETFPGGSVNRIAKIFTFKTF